MTIVVNGERRDVAHDVTVADVVRDLVGAGTGCAVAVNDVVIPRASWPSYAVGPGDRVEVLTAVQGG